MTENIGLYEKTVSSNLASRYGVLKGDACLDVIVSASYPTHQEAQKYRKMPRGATPEVRKEYAQKRAKFHKENADKLLGYFVSEDKMSKERADVFTGQNISVALSRSDLDNLLCSDVKNCVQSVMYNGELRPANRQYSQ